MMFRKIALDKMLISSVFPLLSLLSSSSLSVSLSFFPLLLFSFTLITFLVYLSYLKERSFEYLSFLSLYNSPPPFASSVKPSSILSFSSQNTWWLIITRLYTSKSPYPFRKFIYFSQVTKTAHTSNTCNTTKDKKENKFLKNFKVYLFLHSERKSLVLWI